MRPSVLGKSLCRLRVALVAWFVWAGASGACEECILRTDYEVLLREARHVFVGRVVDAKGRCVSSRMRHGDLGITELRPGSLLPSRVG